MKIIIVLFGVVVLYVKFRVLLINYNWNDFEMVKDVVL